MGFGPFTGENHIQDFQPTLFMATLKTTSKIFHVSGYLLTYFILMGIMPAHTSIAATFTVNSGYDVNDLEPGNGLCVAYLIINPPYVLPFCTLRGAIEETNSLPGEDIIVLGSGTYRLSLNGPGEDQASTGDLDITSSLQLVGAGTDKTFIDGEGLDRVFDILGENTRVTLSQLTITNGNLPAGQPSDQKGGGGVRNRGALFLENVAISKNIVLGATSDDVGGGLLNEGLCSVTNSTIDDNYANEGGGIFNDSRSTLQVFSSTFLGNSSQGGSGLMNHGPAELINTTFSKNSVQGGLSSGGALYNQDQLQLIHCTIAENSANQGGGLRTDGGTVSMVNTLIANNQGDNCYSSGDIISKGHNLDSDNSCGLTSLDLKNIDPQLGLLQDNGGYTKTYGLNPGSPAIDSGKSLPNISSDQRGIPRPQRKLHDIGSVEAFNISIIPFIAPLLLNEFD